MSRVLVIITLTMVAVLAFLSVYFFKDTYKILPIEREEGLFTETNFHDWHEFRDVEDRFQILIPDLPQHAAKSYKDSETGESRDYDMYVAEADNGTVYMINMITFPTKPEIAKQEIVLKTVLKDMISANKKNRLKMRVTSKFQGRDAIDLALENDQNQILSKAFFAGHTLYILTTISNEELFNPNEFQFFTNSFELKEKSYDF